MTAVTRNTEYHVVAVGGGAAGGMAETNPAATMAVSWRRLSS